MFVKAMARQSRTSEQTESLVGRVLTRRMTDRVDRVVVEKIISGGQTGADRAALDWAREHGLPHGGWCPRGRIAEDGSIPRRYRLRQTPSVEHAQRTEWNVRDSDATVIVTMGQTLAGGCLLTRQMARRHGKPCLHLSASAARGDWEERLRRFLRRHRVRVLNVAGPRASEEPGIGGFAGRLLDNALAP
jgi:hypothetical protein